MSEGKPNLYFASSNRHKYEEFRRMLSDLVEVRWVQVKYLEPQCDDLEEVVVTSALWLSDLIPKPFFLEDAGLFIRALGGFPGPFSSYIFSRIGNEGIIKLMEGEEDRKAQFRSAIALHTGRNVITFIGKSEGEITKSPRGNGWGFDPIFAPEGAGGLTFGELGKRKDAFSHRGFAVRELRRFLQGRGAQLFKNELASRGAEG